MSHHLSSVNGEGTSYKNPLSRILDELSALKLWREKKKEKRLKKTKYKSVRYNKCGCDEKIHKKIIVCNTRHLNELKKPTNISD